MERGDPYLYIGSKHNGIERFIQKIQGGVATTPFGGHVTENVSGGRGLNDDETTAEDWESM